MVFLVSFWRCKMTVYDRVKFLLDKRKMTVGEFEEKFGLSTNTTYRWKKNIPNGATLEKLATFFGTSTDYLIGLSDSPFNEKDVDRMLGSAEAYNGQPMTDHDKEVIKAMIKGYMEAKPKD